MSKNNMGIIDESIKKIENMSSEEFYFSLFGHREEEYKEYIKNEFENNIILIKTYINKTGLSCVAYKDKVKEIKWRLFCRVFNEKSKYKDFNLYEYNNLCMNIINGQGTVISFYILK